MEIIFSREFIASGLGWLEIGLNYSHDRSNVLNGGITWALDCFGIPEIR